MITRSEVLGGGLGSPGTLLPRARFGAPVRLDVIRSRSGLDEVEVAVLAPDQDGDALLLRVAVHDVLASVDSHHGFVERHRLAALVVIDTEDLGCALLLGVLVFAGSRFSLLSPHHSFNR